MNNEIQLPVAKVFIIESPKIKMDIEDAERYGELITVFDHRTRRASVFNTDAYSEDLIERLRILGYDPETDHVAVIGSHVSLAVAIAAISIKYGRINLLLFRAGEEGYVSRSLNNEQFQEYEE